MTERLRALKRYRQLYLMFIPVAIWYIVFQYVPMLGIVIAFKDYSVFTGVWDSPWAGLSHFERFLASADFLRTLKNTLLISIYNLCFGFFSPVLFALLLNELTWPRAKRFIQTVSYLPHFISWAVAGGLFYMLLSPGTGVVNELIQALGFAKINFLGEADYFRAILVVTGIWKSMGWGAIIYLAAIAGVDESLHEAAYIDGAGRFRRMWHVTLPSIRTVVVIMLILAVGNILDSNFEQIFIMLNQTVMSTGETIDYYVYRVGLSNANNFSYAAAIGLFKSVIGFLLIILTNVITKKIDEDGGIW